MKNIPARIRDEQEERNDGEKLAESSFIDESENKGENEDEDDENKNDNVVNAKTFEKFEPRWHKNRPPTPAYTFLKEKISAYHLMMWTLGHHYHILKCFGNMISMPFLQSKLIFVAFRKQVAH